MGKSHCGRDGEDWLEEECLGNGETASFRSRYGKEEAASRETEEVEVYRTR